VEVEIFEQISTHVIVRELLGTLDNTLHQKGGVAFTRHLQPVGKV
jgi:hypothetical protein